MKIHFAKYEGAGNDFVIVDNRDSVFDPAPEAVSAVCSRRFGIGADGMMLLERDPGYDFRMRYFNSDGPEATMCGNGGRCMALFALRTGVVGTSMTFSAVDGVHRAAVLSCSGERGMVSLGMSDSSEIEEFSGGYFIDTGSPHYVVFVEDADAVDVFAEGRRMRGMDEFVRRGGANFDFVQVMPGGALKIRTYERGVEDETLACGTGAVAAAAVASRVCFPDRDTFELNAAGGRLDVAFRPAGGIYRDIVLTGPARGVFTGVFDTENF